jgi:hypothetical protein
VNCVAVDVIDESAASFCAAIEALSSVWKYPVLSFITQFTSSHMMPFTPACGAPNRMSFDILVTSDPL